jgi:hypothetical protein
MEVTLKKASDLGKAALEAANKIKISKSIRISIYGESDPKALIDEAAAKARQQLSDIQELISTHYDIKVNIGEANDRAGITKLMRRVAEIEALIKALTTNVKMLEPNSDILGRSYGVAVDVEANVTAIRERIDLSKKRLMEKDSGTVEDSFTVSVIPEALIEDTNNIVLLLKKQKANASEQLAALNVNTKITLSFDNVEVLKKHKLL